MSSYPCPKGHASADPDFCSECGAKIAGAPTPESAAQGGNAGKAGTCPDCGYARASFDVTFCEVCGFNYTTGAHGEIAVAATPAITEPVDGLTPTPKWSVQITVETAGRDEGSPEPPADFESISIDLHLPVNLIGRRSAARAIDPEIPLDFDDAVSHRHAILTRADDGGLLLRDIGSSNGTELNGTAVSPMTDHALKDGDRLAVGHWTRLTVKTA